MTSLTVWASEEWRTGCESRCFFRCCSSGLLVSADLLHSWPPSGPPGGFTSRGRDRAMSRSGRHWRGRWLPVGLRGVVCFSSLCCFQLNVPSHSVFLSEFFNLALWHSIWLLLINKIDKSLQSLLGFLSTKSFWWLEFSASFFLICHLQLLCLAVVLLYK